MLKTSFYLKIILIKVLFSYSIFSQPFPPKYNFEKYSIEHGLSSSAIYSLHQDKMGFIWIGTENGLNRYDGYSFKIFKHNPEDSNTISDNFIWDIAEDISGNLWFATNRGLNKYDPIRGKFTIYLHNPDDSSSISGNEISSLAFDSENNLWIGTWASGFNIYNFKQKKFYRYSSENTSITKDIIWCIFKDSRKNIWIGTEEGGLARYNFQDKTFENFFENEKKSSMKGSIFTSVCEDKNGFIWIGTYGSGLNRYDYKTNSFINFRSKPGNDNSIADNYIWKVLTDSENNLWISGVSKGLTRYDLQKNIFTRFKSNPYDFNSISSDLNFDLIQDKSGNLWIGTINGLNKINLNPQNFYHIKNDINNPNSLIGNFIFSVCEDKNGEIWIASYEKGISRYNPSKNKFIFYTHNPNDPGSISTNQVRLIYEDKQGDLWIGTYFGGLHKYDRKKDSFIRYQAGDAEGEINSNNIRLIYEDSENNFWIGTSGGGLNKFDKINNKFSHYTHNPGDYKSISNNTITAICEDEDGNLWAGTYDGGLNKFNKKNNTFIRYFYNKDDPNSLSSNIITFIFKDLSGRLWVGTWGGGLNLYNKKNDNFIRVREKDGLLSDIICGIGEDKKGNLWISTVKGISKLNYDKKLIKNYDINDGIQKGELNPNAFFINKKGWIFFGGTDGVNAFHPDSLFENKNIPSVTITSFKKFNEELITEYQPEYLKELELNYDDNVISFEFASLDFSNPLKNQAAYKLEGFDKDWVYPSKGRYATYTHLDPGRYIFKVKGSNNSGLWNEKGTELILIINPPFWDTWWFRGIIILLIAGILYSFYRIRLNRLLEMERLRVKIASDLHDEIGSALTRLSIESELLMSESNSEERISSVKRIGSMSREIISSMSDVVWSIDSRNDSIEDLINRMKDFSYSLFSAKNKQVLFEISNLNLQKKIKVDIRQNIYLIFKEAVNNSAKYSCSDSFKILLKNEEGKFVMIIHDPDTEFASKKLTGQGLRNMKMRAERIGGKVEFIKEEGFKVVLTAKEL